MSDKENSDGSKGRDRDRSRRRKSSKSRSPRRRRRRSGSGSRDRERRRRRSSRSRSGSKGSSRKSKKKGNWDVGADSVDAQQQAAAVQQMMQARAQQLQMGNKRACELYVGNLAIGVVTQDMLSEFFTKLLTAIPDFDIKRGQPVLGVQLHTDGKYAFVQFRDEVTAATAIKFDKIQFQGRALNIGRPGGYTPTAAGAKGMDIPAEMLASLGLHMPAMMAGLGGMGLMAITAPVGDKKQRELYVGNLAVGAVTAESLRQLLMAPLMPLLQPGQGPPIINVTMDSSGKFAFVEFRDEAMSAQALRLFDKMQLHGRPLHVGRPTGYIDPNGMLTTAAMGGMGPMGGMGDLGNMGMMMGGMGLALPGINMGIPGAGLAAGVVANGIEPGATTVVSLENLVNPNELADDQTYGEIVEDIQEECSKNGRVIQVKVPRPGPGHEAVAQHLGKAFVQFADVEAACGAKRSLHGRKFGGNIVRATFMPSMPY